MTTLDDPRHERYLDWLCTLRKDRVPETLAALAAEFGVNVRTLRDWKEKPEFVKEHEARVRRITGAPERTQEVLAALHELSLDSQSAKQVQAAKTWLDATGFLRREVTKATGDTSALSNEQLMELVEAKAREIAEQRGIRLVKGA